VTEHRVRSGIVIAVARDHAGDCGYLRLRHGLGAGDIATLHLQPVHWAGLLHALAIRDQVQPLETLLGLRLVVFLRLDTGKPDGVLLDASAFRGLN